MPSKKYQLHQFLSKCGVFKSKEELVNAVHDGRILVDTKVITDIRYEINPRKKEVRYAGKVLQLPQENVYFLLNKPLGVICSRLNSHERELNKKSVFSLFEGKMSETIFQSLYTVGRLDEDTTGLLIVTNDGPIGKRITDPESHIPKSYHVMLQQPITEDQQTRLRNGVVITLEEDREDGQYTTRPETLVVITPTRIRLTITEGKKREIRRMVEAVGNKVVALHRESIGTLVLLDFGIPIGEYRAVSKDVVAEKVFGVDAH